MSRPTLHQRMPRAGIDRIDRAASALLAIELVMHRPHRYETLLLLLDQHRCGVGLVVVSDTVHPDAVVDVVERIAESNAGCDRVGAIVVASVRPLGPGSSPEPVAGHVGEGRDDVDRWLEMSSIAEDLGIELVEWFVIAGSVTCPRDRLGAPARW